eukprot:6716358-Prymnesium_polylepis.1
MVRRRRRVVPLSGICGVRLTVERGACCALSSRQDRQKAPTTECGAERKSRPPPPRTRQRHTTQKSDLRKRLPFWRCC